MYVTIRLWVPEVGQLTSQKDGLKDFVGLFFSLLPMKYAHLERTCFSFMDFIDFSFRYCTSGLPTDIVIEVGEMSFHIHKVLLYYYV